ncbi:MAG TPA: hypothetical protein VJT72_05735 [Pseudonocardiaceae bacterium]|nr:hypothetical protein [Pseudonocardiaceae bacterium]
MTVMSYRTQDGLADYGFSIEFQPSEGWRIYIVFEPFRPGNKTVINWPYQSVEDGRCRVDWPSKLDSLGEAKTVAALWAELAQRYQRVQDEHALYVTRIERQQRTHDQRRTTPAAPDRLSNTIDADRAGTGHQNGGSVIPHPTAAAKSSSDLQQSEVILIS